MGIAVFNITDFLTRYPEFTAVNAANPARLPALFSDAGILYLNNTSASPVRNVARRTLLLYMLTAHQSFLSGDLTADGQPRPVGRVSQAAEGSVSASFEMNPPTAGSGPWYAQTPYGAAFWQATSAIRGFRYFARPTNPNGFPRYDGGFGRRF
jgi:Protein of unknown function (DUF4054)